MSKYKLSKLLGQDAFWMINKDLAKKVGIEAALILSDLISKYEYFEGLGQLKKYDGESYFYYTTESIKEETTLGRRSQDAGIKILIEKCLIKTLVKGTPAKKHFTILEDNILKLLIEKDVSECTNSTNNNSQSVQTGLYETDKLECTKRTNSNKNRLNRINKDIKESDSKNHTPLNDVPNFVKEEQKKIEPHVAKIVPKVEDVEREMRDSITLKESAIKINKITEKECSEFLEEFFAHTRGYDKEVKSVSDHKRHFLAWIKTQISAKNNKVDYGKKQFAKPVDHIQKRCPEADNYDF